MQSKSIYSLLHRICASALIVLHLLVFGPLRDAALAFSASSASYSLSSSVINEGGKNRSAAQTKLWQDSMGEPCAGKAQSASFILDSGFIPLIQSNPPVLTQNIPCQNWEINTVKSNVFDLDDYFSSTDGYPLTFNVTGNSKINITIAPITHTASFSQSQNWFGVEKVYFTATDTEGSTVRSNEVVLQVANSLGKPNKPVIVNMSLASTSNKEGVLVTLTVKAYDLDKQDLTFFYTDFFTESRRWKDGDFWYSEATWQASAHSLGHYTAKATISDGILTDTSSIIVSLGNSNHPPVLDNIPDIAVNEGALAIITPHATDSDNDPIVFYYSAPFDTQGKWLTNYDNAGIYNIQVTASDGIDTVSKTAKVIVNNINCPPQTTLTLSKYTTQPNEEFSATISAIDPDGDTMSYVLKKDNAEFASGSFNSTNSKTFTLSFSNASDHSISATVTDSGGLSATDSKGVDVAEPASSINPVMGDFNGDALTDLGLHNSDTGTWEVCLSDKGVFRNAVTWLTGFGASKDSLPIGGDFNADSKTDIGIYNYTTGELQIALSQGSGFGTPKTVLTFSNTSYSWQPFTGNFNGDKYTDIGFYNKDTGEAKVALGTGNVFGLFTIWNAGFGTNYIAMSGDFNADGLSDLCLFKKSSGEFKVAFSNASTFIDGATWISGFSVNQDALISDFNNDGLTDIGYWNKSDGKWYYAISTGVSFTDKGVWLDGFGQSTDESATTGDFDGNGITDAACFDRDQLGINRWSTRLSTNKPADLLTQIDNGIGGKTKIIYTYAADNDNSNLPFPVYVASSISLENTFPADRAATYTQNFTFSGGYFDAQEREFRGFAKVRVIDPITNNYSETYFYQGTSGQDGALKGQIDKIIAYDGNSRKISQAINTYEVKKSGPQDKLLGFPALIERDTTVWEENDTNLSTKNKITYDNIGNSLQEESDGDISKTGDEKYTATIFTQAYEAGFTRPLETILKDKDDKVVSKKSFEYDSRGNLVKEIAWLLSSQNDTAQDVSLRGADNSVSLRGAEGDEAISSTYSYDSFGNAASTTNALGSTVTTDYETDSYAYPQKVTNSLGHSIQYVYDPKFGAIKSSADPNGVSLSTYYDSLGRVIKTTRNENSASLRGSAVGGDEVILSTFTYPDFNTKTSTNAIGLFKTEYIDGLGRKYKTVSSGEDGENAREISSEVFYNERGLTEKESLAHYADEDPAQISYSRYVYDIRGRVKKTIADFPGSTADSESLINYVNPLYTESTDPLGHRKGAKKDVYGNILEVTDFTSAGVFKTAYEYDIQNNLIKTTDNQGNITQIFYDSLGRKIKMTDPDMGTWTYEYDLLGNLKKQTDAKGQVLQFEYDQLNRLIKKVSLRGVPVGDDEAILTQYFYDDNSKDNCLGRLSKITDQSGSTEFFYDKLGREIKSTKMISLSPSGRGQGEGNTYTVLRDYDILDRLTKLTYPDGEAVTYTYDIHSGLLESLRGVKDAEAISYVKDIAYNAKGQTKNISYGNGVVTNYTYGQDLRLSRINTSEVGDGNSNSSNVLGGGSGQLQDLNYNFDHNGNLTTLTDNLRSNTRTYTYDSLDRLTRAENSPAPGGGYTNFDYQYDSIGNMIYKSDVGAMSYGQNAGPHAVTFAGGYFYQYDTNGNMTVGKNKTLEYDAENRLTKTTENTGAVTTFIYDGDGGRVRKTVSLRGVPVGDDEAISTIYIGSLCETDSGGKTTKHIFAGANRICSVSLRGGEAAEAILNYYHSDHLGSSSIITDKNGNQIEHYEYTPYGTTAVGDVIASPEGAKQSIVHHKFTGKELDNTGLYFYGARYYDPEIGRFITPDTIVQALYDSQSMNRYSYCRNNPINYIDPTGHWWLQDIFKEINRWFSQAERGLEKATGAEWDININTRYSVTTNAPTQIIATIPCGFVMGLSAWFDEPRFKIINLNNKISSMESGDNGFINGILSDEAVAIKTAKRIGANRILYNPSDGLIADLTEAFLQKITFTSSMDRQIANSIKGLNNIRLSGHSQGGIILSNVLINLGTRGEKSVVSKVDFYSTQISQPQAYLSAFIAGVNWKNITYGNHTWDPSNIVGPNLSPVKFGGGVIGATVGFFGIKYHGVQNSRGQDDK